MNRVAVVVLNYKGIDDTVACIASLARQNYPDFTIIAVENGSGDGSKARFKELEKTYSNKLQALYNNTNLGFTGGVNTGIRWALQNNYNYIALFNNDATADKNWVKNLIACAEKHKTGITTGLLLLEDGKTIDTTGDWFSKWGLPFPRNRHEPIENMAPAGPVFGATGGATLYSAKMLREIGLFDEDLFAYYEDVDISFRAQLAGYKVYFEPTAIGYHKLSQTSKRIGGGFTIYHTFKNWPIVFIKNVPRGLLFSIGIRFYLAYVLMLGHAIMRGQGVPALKGAGMGFLLGFKKIIERWHIQKNKKVSTAYIKDMLWDDLPPDQTGLRKFRAVFTGKK